MSCKLFAKVNKSLSTVQGILGVLRDAQIEVVDLSAKPSLDQRHFFLQLTLDSEVGSVKPLFESNSDYREVQIN